MDIKKQLSAIIKRLKKEYPAPKTALSFRNPFELLVATVLSAQTTDVHVNRVTGTLFKKYKSVKDYADVPLDELRKDVSSINFYNNKAKNIQASARMIIEQFGGKVPKTMDELTQLPGVARKTANIILFGAFGINEGIAVDTHVKRLSCRLGLTKNEDPVRIERDLMAITPREEWGNMSNLLIFHGRKICQAKKPNHGGCVLYDICPSRGI
ncbi:MAG TPA: endonuclease III [Thermodesulfovibrionales bacterium]|nr:endonuclease III [Thermodesulfovibrionales bacterium]